MAIDSQGTVVFTCVTDIEGRNGKALSNHKLSLRLDKTYTLEEIYALNKTALTKMCWLFDVSGWVGDVPKLLHEAISHIPRFSSAYHALEEKQQSILAFLSASGGKPVPVELVYKEYLSKLSVKEVDAALSDLLEKGWLLAGESHGSLLAIPDFKKTLDTITAFYQFLEAELPSDYAAVNSGGQYLTDLVEVAAFVYIEKPKLTVKKFMSKSMLRRLMLRLSPVAANQWEEAAAESLYTNTMRMLLGMLQEMGALKVVPGKEGHYCYQLNEEKWDDFIFSPAPQRLLYVLSWQITRIQYHKGGSLPFIVSLLKQAARVREQWLTGASLMMKSIVDESSVLFSDKDPFSSEDWLEAFLLEPFMYCGLFEKTTAELPAQWLIEKKMPRNFWRLTSVGFALAKWLEGEDNASQAIGKMVKFEMQQKTAKAFFKPLLSKWQHVLPAELEQQLIIQPDLSFLVPKNVSPYVLWMLSVFADTQVQDYVYQGAFSRNSVLRALKGGACIDDLFAMIHDHSKVPPAENALSTLRQWAVAYDKTLFSRAMMLACDTPEMAMEILAQSKLANWIIGEIGPRVLLIKPEGETVIRKWLEKKNWVSRTGVAAGDELYSWLQR